MLIRIPPSLILSLCLRDLAANHGSSWRLLSSEKVEDVVISGFFEENVPAVYRIDDKAVAGFDKLLDRAGANAAGLGITAIVCHVRQKHAGVGVRRKKKLDAAANALRIQVIRSGLP